MQKEFTLLSKLFELDVETHKIVKKFEKSERHVLSAEIRQTVALLAHLLIKASRTQLAEQRAKAAPQRTLALLREFDVELEYFQLQVRKAHALRLINDACYGAWSARATEVGRMLGTWIKRVEASVVASRPRQQGRLEF